MLLTKVIGFGQSPKRIQLSHFGEEVILLAQANKRQSEAFQEGYEKATQEYNQRILEMRQDIVYLENTFFLKINQEFEKIADAIGKRIPDLAINLVRKVLGGIDLDSERLHAIIQSTIDEMNKKEGMIDVVISQEDFAILDSADSQWQKKYNNIRFSNDSNLKRGDCVMRTNFGIINATMETKINTLQKELVAK